MSNDQFGNNNELWGDVHQKVGKCLVLFQRIELLFKYAVSRGCFSLVVSTNPESTPPIDQLKKNANHLSQKTMGCVGRLFCDKILSDNSSTSEDGDLSKDEIRFSVNIKFGTNEQQIVWKSKIEAIILERNKIVHQLFTTFDFNKPEDFANAVSYLDDTHNEASILYGELSQLAKSIPEFLKTSFSSLPHLFVLKNPYDSQFEKELIVMMQYYAESRRQYRKTNGWTNLADTGSFLNRQCPSALEQCKIKHKTRSIKRIVENLAVFDIKSIGENNQTVLFRMNPEYWIEKDTKNQLYICKQLPDGKGYLQDDLGMSLVEESTSIEQ
nr:hypothetical protein [uncultured Desulfobulbus sp.]